MNILAIKSKDHKEPFVQSLFHQINKEDLEAEIHKALKTQNEKIIEICLKNLTLPQLTKIANAENIFETAQNEAYYLPKPAYLSSLSFIMQELPSPNIFRKLIKFSVHTFANAFSADLDSPPTNNWAAQGQINLFISFSQGVKWVIEKLYSLFDSKLKTAWAASTILMSLAGVRLLYNHFQLGTPDVINKDQMTNLSRKAKEGLLKKTTGRSDEIQKLITALTPSPIEKPKIAFLLGPPGVGKTQLVEGLAIKMAEGTIPALRGKRLFSVNTASLTEQGNYSENGYRSRLDLIFKEIQGYEQDVILFFDEAHNAASNSSKDPDSSGNGHLIEQLKTKLLERSMFVILATTQKEYEQHIAPNKAFVERTEVVEVPPLSDMETTLVLQDAIENETVKITQDAIEETLKIGKTHKLFKERANPRKSFDILQKAVKHVISWSPTTLQKKLEAKEIELCSHKTACRTKAEQTPHWISTSEGKQNLAQLRSLEQEITCLKASLKTEEAALKSISFLRTLEDSSFKKHCELVHLMVDPKRKNGDETEKNYIFYRYILLPCIRKKLAEEVAAFENKYHEKVPLAVNKEILQKLFK